MSSAYYAFFHLLVADGSHMMVKNRQLRGLVRRAFQHATMVEASKSFQAGHLPLHLAGVLAVPLSKPLRDVAAAFVDLQDARHDADYNVGRRFFRSEAEAILIQANGAFQLWREEVSGPEKEVYLASLLLWKQWRR